MNPETGRFIIFAGIALVFVGLLIYFFHDKIQWIGRLPGDIRVERENFKFYFPITTMLLISLIATLIIRIIRRF